ncbi:MAG TPA: LysR substrate-binding domain-containing protein [Diaminobutyricibacter sp.]|jgi:DNA-binding transcriptional LysR family regulator
MPKTPDVTTAQLAYFAEAADQLNMTRAAENLLVAQSAVSSSIAQLERSLGVQLFIRQPSKGLILTAAGERLHHEARSLLTRLDEALEAARGQESEVRGTVTLACFATLMPFYIPGLLSVLAATHPQLRVDVLESDAEGVREAIRTGRAELGLTYDFGLGGNIRTAEIARTTPYVLLPESHRLARADGIHLARLRGEPMVILDLPLSRDYFLGLLHDAGVEPEIRYRSGNYETVRSLVAQGHGFSLLNQVPRSSVTYGGGSVTAVPILDHVDGLPVVVSWLNGVRPTARSRAVSTGLRSLPIEASIGETS